KTGYTFNPASRDFTSANNGLNFAASESEANDLPEGATAITTGQTLREAISRAGDVDWFKFTAIPQELAKKMVGSLT
ncbi:MAG TPA: hypothetical protein PK407_17645, partial [Verrucomicrobiota bacterium]|nr:hypothetical protein [Verrucomicrobiota bacterium]